MRSFVCVLVVALVGCRENVRVFDSELHCSDSVPTFCIEHVDTVRREDYTVIWQVSVEAGDVSIRFPYMFVGLVAYSVDDASWLANMHGRDMWIEFPDGSKPIGDQHLPFGIEQEDHSLWTGGMIFDPQGAFAVPATQERSFMLGIRTDRLEAAPGDQLTVQITNGYLEERESAEGIAFLHYPQVDSTIVF